ncbi:MAG: Sialate O-acetylesterase [Verrucomicrobia bacterium]|nr:Sialate O-acetylesterase [Verrucomicrobiota bacterium]
MNHLRFLSCALSLVSLARADVTLAPLFRDHAVMQRDMALPIWGRADAGEHVTVTFKGQTIGTTTPADGRWIVYLDEVPASAEPADLVVTGKNSVTVSDILVGEVWLVSGQSNMEWPVSKANDAAREMAGAQFPLIRHIKIDRVVGTAPAETATSSGWLSATPETVGDFSAIAYFFARDLHRKLGVPIGIVNSSWGGTPIEAWMDDRALRGTAAFPAVDARWQKVLAEFPEKQAKYLTDHASWEKAEAVAVANHTKNPVVQPRAPVGPGTPYVPSGLYNAMIAPLQPWALRGMLWYQGEGNWARPGEYAELFPAMIRGWRKNWGQGNVPFYFVQLAAFNQPDDTTRRGWALLREAQGQAQLLPAVEVATAIDIGDPSNIHPRNKQEVGRRLALIAKTQVYGISGDFSGPVFQRAVREGSAMRVYFSHVTTGLISYDKPVQSLEIAGADRKFFPATAKIEHSTLLVTSPSVREPVAVRYAWSNAPVANLYSGAGLPALPFRSAIW